MSTLPDTDSDSRLRRKIAVLRALFVLLETAVVVLILVGASTGELLARASLSGARADSQASLRTIYWADSPIMYAVNILWLIGIFSAFIFGAYLALAKLTTKFHGRPLLRRRYPY